VKALLHEIEQRSNYLQTKEINSIYFGGGTPSLLAPQDLEEILEKLAVFFNWGKGTEITLEANPDDMTAASLHNWKLMGINRLSIGLQSFNEDELKWMNRAHTAKESVSSVKLAQDKGFHNLSIDLIYGSKFQTVDSWKKTLQEAIALQTTHISSYNLTIEAKTVLGLKHSKGKEPGINDELSTEQFLILSELLGGAGFDHYEISNFARPGFYAQHNSNYWLQQPYLGLGPSAHSYNGVSRQWNVGSNTHYVQAIRDGKPFFEIENLSVNDRYNEYILTRLRTSWGCDVTEIEKLFGEKLAAYFKKNVESKSTFFMHRHGVYTLTPTARLMADGIASDLFI
jgi:oxygen-independent coproporphyrinogen-3 oxidase